MLFKECKHLRELNVFGCPKIKPSLLATLSAQRPRTQSVGRTETLIRGIEYFNAKEKGDYDDDDDDDDDDFGDGDGDTSRAPPSDPISSRT